MSVPAFTLELGGIDLASLRTEEDFQKAARRLLPAVLFQAGERLGEKTWSDLHKGGGAANPKATDSDRQRFVREMGQNYQKQANPKDRKLLEERIVTQLKELKGK
jgi:hypothetical protein